MKPSNPAIALVLLGVPSVACNVETDHGEHTREKSRQHQEERPQTEQLEEDAASQADNPSPQAISVIWSSATSRTGSSFPVRVSNNTRKTYVVALSLEATGPGVAPTSYEFMELRLSGKQERVVPIQLDDMPVQSTEYPSSLRVVARYSALDSATSTVSFSAPLLVTSHAGFSEATARTVAEQVQARDLDVDDLVPKNEGGETRRRNENGSYSVVAQEDSDLSWVPTITFAELPSPGDLTKARHFPDTAPEGEEH